MRNAKNKGRSQALARALRLSNKSPLLMRGLLPFLVFSLCGCGPTANNNEQINQPINSAKPVKPSAPMPANLNRTMKSEHFRAHFSSHTKQDEVEGLLKTLEDAHANYSLKLSSLGLNLNAVSSIEILIHDSTGDFTSSTGQSWWTSAVTKDNLIEIQPLDTLRKRGILEKTLRHELAHAFIHAVNKKPVPRWLDEGTAIHLSGEGEELLKVELRNKLTVDEIEKRLSSLNSYEEMRELYASAYREVLNIIRNEGESALWKRICEV